MRQITFTTYRRDAIAKIIFDVIRIAVGAGFASQFFVDFPPHIRQTIVKGGVVFLLAGLLICPKRTPGRGR